MKKTNSKKTSSKKVDAATERKQKEYSNLRAASGLSATEFIKLCDEKLVGCEKTADAWLDAARVVYAEVTGRSLELFSRDTQEVAPVKKAEEEKPQTLRKKTMLPVKSGFVVIYTVSVEGDVTYKHLDEESSVEEDGAVHNQKSIKTVERVVRNVEEHTKAQQIAGSLRTALRRLGTPITPGAMLIPFSKEAEFDAALTEINREAADFNRIARNHVVRHLICKTQMVMSEEEKVARDLAYDLQNLMDEMKDALDRCDSKRIREVAVLAKAKAAVLPAGKESGMIAAAVQSARNLASEISRELQQKGQSVEKVRERLDTSVVDSARMMFLEYELPAEVTGSEVVNKRMAELEL
jgi:hypothetical protein